MSSIVTIGHRGAAGYVAENTLASFEKAISLGVDMVELDVRRCKTGELMVIHDDKIARTTNGRGMVHNLTLEQLRQFQTKNKQLIPTLAEVFDLVNRRAVINIELKVAGIAQRAEALVTSYVKEKGWSYDDFIISSFQHKELIALKEYNPQIRRAPLFERLPRDFSATIATIAPYAINPSYRTVTPAMVEMLHQQGIKIFVWTVNKEKQIKKMVALGVDGIISDYPDRVK
jgi:glycerophosphoryl diester phosphodiesterase